MYYNTDENQTPAPGTDHKHSTDSFEQFKRKRAEREAAAGFDRRRMKASAVSTAQEIKNRIKNKR